MTAPGRPPPKEVCPRVCIFDIDNTVTVGADHDPKKCPVLPGAPPAWPASGSGTTKAVKDAIERCHNSGYKIAFTSAESRTEGDNATQKAFIRSLDPTGGKLFTPEFFSSPAYQNSWDVIAKNAADAKLEFGHKEAMFLNVLKHYEVSPSCFSASIVFDDQTENLWTARNLGLRSVQSSLECGGVYCTKGCGLSESAASVIDTTI